MTREGAASALMFSLFLSMEGATLASATCSADRPDCNADLSVSGSEALSFIFKSTLPPSVLLVIICTLLRIRAEKALARLRREKRGAGEPFSCACTATVAPELVALLGARASPAAGEATPGTAPPPSRTPPRKASAAASGEASQEMRGGNEADSPSTPPVTYWLGGSIVHCGCNIMLTILTPSSHKVVDYLDAGNNGGMLIAMYGIGAMVSLPAFYWLGCRRVRACLYTHGAMVLLGGLLYVFGLWSVKVGLHRRAHDMLLIARFITGASQGVNYTMSLGLSKSTTMANRAEFIAYWSSAGGVGLMLGPALGSFSDLAAVSAAGAGDLEARLIAPALVACAYGVLILLGTTVLSPDSESLRAATERHQLKQGPTVTGSAEAGALGAFLMPAGSTVRTMLRVTWEVSAILLFAKWFGTQLSGTWLAATVVVYVVAAAAFGWVMRGFRMQGITLSDHSVIMFFEVATLASMGMMLCSNIPGFFLLGSTILYCSNNLSGTPLMAFSIRLGSQGTWHSVDTVMCVNQFCCLAAFFFAPVYSRMVSAVGSTSEWYTVMALVPIFACQVLLNEIGMGSFDFVALEAAGEKVAQDFDIVMPMLQPRWCTRAVLEGLVWNYCPRAIHIITPEAEVSRMRELVEGWGIINVHMHAEDTFFPGHTKQEICAELDLKGGLYRPGWFYQQLLKLGASEGIQGLSEWFLVWDSDMLPVKTWPVLEAGSDGPKHTIALVQHNAYGNAKIVAHWHEWIRKVLGVDALIDSEGTFVPHHMWFREQHLRGFKAQVQKSFSSQEHWAVLMMRSVNTLQTFSEYWAYSSWVAATAPEDLSFHPYAGYGATNERFFDDGVKGRFSQALRRRLEQKGAANPDSAMPSYDEFLDFISTSYSGSPLPSSINFEQSERYMDKPEETLTLEERRSRWNTRVSDSEEAF